MRRLILFLVVGATAGCRAQQPVPAVQGDPALEVRPIALPGANGPLSLDYLACDRASGRLWIPAAGTGSVDVLETATGALKRIEGFATQEREIHGATRRMGPSSATLGAGFVYAGNRADSSVCAIDVATLQRGACVTLASSPDGLQYVAATKEVWATTPRAKSITVLDASDPAKLVAKAEVPLDGEPEGYAVDEAKGLFFTNLEDKDRTLVIDVKTRKVLSDWPAGCGAEGPRGIALERARGWAFVACTDAVEVLDLAHAGTRLSRLDTGAGVDNIDYLESRRLLYVAAGKAARLTVAQVGDDGSLRPVVSVPTSAGARTVVVDASGASYLVDPAQGRVLRVASPP
ncbi:MAG TPA: hypothetical protein VGK67_36430 [Myxococcales bacterium]|jgi:DNA-binding beta-propeller fold protein YncE